MDAEMMRSDETNVLKLDGSWTIERADELKCALLEALNGGERIVIELGGLTDLDLSSLQLLCSAHRMSLRLGKHLAFHKQKSENLKQVVRNAGFIRTIGCHKDPCKSCLWVGDWKS